MLRAYCLGKSEFVNANGEDRILLLQGRRDVYKRNQLKERQELRSSLSEVVSDNAQDQEASPSLELCACEEIHYHVSTKVFQKTKKKMKSLVHLFVMVILIFACYCYGGNENIRQGLKEDHNNPSRSNSKSSNIAITGRNLKSSQTNTEMSQTLNEFVEGYIKLLEDITQKLKDKKLEQAHATATQASRILLSIFGSVIKVPAENEKQVKLLLKIIPRLVSTLQQIRTSVREFSSVLSRNSYYYPQNRVNGLLLDLVDYSDSTQDDTEKQIVLTRCEIVGIQAVLDSFVKSVENDLSSYNFALSGSHFKLFYVISTQVLTNIQGASIVYVICTSWNIDMRKWDVAKLNEVLEVISTGVDTVAPRADKDRTLLRNNFQPFLLTMLDSYMDVEENKNLGIGELADGLLKLFQNRTELIFYPWHVMVMEVGNTPVRKGFITNGELTIYRKYRKRIIFITTSQVRTFSQEKFNNYTQCLSVVREKSRAEIMEGQVCPLIAEEFKVCLETYSIIMCTEKDTKMEIRTDMDKNYYAHDIIGAYWYTSKNEKEFKLNVESPEKDAFNIFWVI